MQVFILFNALKSTLEVIITFEIEAGFADADFAFGNTTNVRL